MKKILLGLTLLISLNLVANNDGDHGPGNSGLDNLTCKLVVYSVRDNDNFDSEIELKFDTVVNDFQGKPIGKIYKASLDEYKSTISTSKNSSLMMVEIFKDDGTAAIAYTNIAAIKALKGEAVLSIGSEDSSRYSMLLCK